MVKWYVNTVDIKKLWSHLLLEMLMLCSQRVNTCGSEGYRGEDDKSGS